MTVEPRISMRKLTAAAVVALFAAGGLGLAYAQQSGGMDHCGTGGGAAGQGCASQGGMGHGGMGHGMGGMMGQGGMSHEGMGHGGMDHGGAKAQDQGHGGGHHAMMRGMMCGMSEHVDGRLAYLRAELKLTEQQSAQWTAFADGFRAAAQKTAQQCAAMDAGKDQVAPGGAPSGVLEQLAKMERHMTAHLESVRAVKSAAEPLFAALTDEQKKTANEVMTEHMAIGMGGMGKMKH